MRRTIYKDRDGNKMDGVFYYTDPCISDFEYHGIEPTEVFNDAATVDGDHILLSNYESSNRMIEAARDAGG